MKEEEEQEQQAAEEEQEEEEEKTAGRYGEECDGEGGKEDGEGKEGGVEDD